MYRKRLPAVLIVCLLVITSPDHISANQQSKPGLAGTYFNSEDFLRPEPGIDILTSLDNDWGRDRGTDWTARWRGSIEGPFSGEITFTAEATDGLRLKIGDTVVIDGFSAMGSRTGKVAMTRGKKAPIVLEFVSLQGKAKLRLYWQWQGRPRVIVLASAISHDSSRLPRNAKVFDYEHRESQKGEESESAPSANLPRFTGPSPPYADTDYHDGRFRPVVGAHNFEVIRCNRTHPELVTDDIPSYPDAEFENVGFTYNHQPMLCYWHNRFWVIYESGPAHEHQPPCYALITWSEDGRNWHKPQTIFPAKKFRNRKENNKLQYSLSHQRMNWYVASDRRLIASGFHGMPYTPNDGKGIGRVVREIKGPGNYGPIYWVRYNEFQGYNKDNSPYYPFYKEAPDKGFVKAIDELLANKLMMQQWYEEDGDKNSGFFALSGYRTRYLKAFDWYYLPDGGIVGMWKWKKMAVAGKREPGHVGKQAEWERGHISKQGEGENIYYGGAKIWGQRTSEGRYALVYNPVKNTRWRHPLSVTTSDDGMSFDTYFLNVQGETPLMRFGGANKDGGGAQYVRGIIPGNGTPPDGAMWLTYSSNKEDIWVARVPVPIRGTVDKDVNDDFEDMKPGRIVTDWNIYTGIWVPVAVVKDNGRDPSGTKKPLGTPNNVLRLQDKAPYNYAKAVRVFPETKKAKITFRLRTQKIGRDSLEIELQNYKGQRPVRIKIDSTSGKILANNGTNMIEIAPFKTRKWLNFEIAADTTAGKYDVRLNGKKVVSGAAFAETLTNTDNPYDSKFNKFSAPTVERIVFRTGEYRQENFSRYGFGANDYRKNEPDLTGADEPVDNAIFDIDEFRTIGMER